MNGCARIDNNRREYCTHRAAQLCVHACVLRFFLFFFKNTIYHYFTKPIYAVTLFTTFFGFVFCWICCARIDNNRREYCVLRAAQLCVHACVLRFFSCFCLRFFVYRLLQKKMLISFLLLFNDDNTSLQ